MSGEKRELEKCEFLYLIGDANETFRAGRVEFACPKSAVGIAFEG